MIKVTLTNEILKKISEIDEKRFSLSTIEMPPVIKNRLRKNSKKKSSYASNKIEGNPLTEKQANEAIDSDPHKHFLKPEQEVRNYFLALNFLEEKLKKNEAFSKEMILEVQAMVEKGASKEKIGLRGPMPPGMLFAVYDSETGAAEYIPPEYIDIPDLLDELVEYVNTTGTTGGIDGDYSYSFSDNQIVEFIDLLNQVELGGKVDENKASSNGAVSYYTIYFAIDETLTIIPGEYFKIGDTFYEFDNYDELRDKFIVFNSTK